MKLYHMIWPNILCPVKIVLYGRIFIKWDSNLDLVSSTIV